MKGKDCLKNGDGSFRKKIGGGIFITKMEYKNCKLKLLSLINHHRNNIIKLIKKC